MQNLDHLVLKEGHEEEPGSLKLWQHQEVGFHELSLYPFRFKKSDRLKGTEISMILRRESHKET